MTTKLFLATLVTPTATNDLYEWSSNELATLYDTKVFGSVEAAIRWATNEVEAENDALRESGADDEDLFRLVHTKRDDEAVLVWWTTADDIEDSHVEDTFCLRVVEAAVEG